MKFDEMLSFFHSSIISLNLISLYSYSFLEMVEAVETEEDTALEVVIVTIEDLQETEAVDQGKDMTEDVIVLIAGIDMVVVAVEAVVAEMEEEEEEVTEIDLTLALEIEITEEEADQDERIIDVASSSHNLIFKEFYSAF